MIFVKIYDILEIKFLNIFTLTEWNSGGILALLCT